MPKQKLNRSRTKNLLEAQGNITPETITSRIKTQGFVAILGLLQSRK